ncbi:TadE/TadG family type IV pilus assembly protein [Nocardioides sp. SOB77]|uniref:TadE/TadG family type IV pilus assembly protein n=1 Tax=Nocardioides oceani TaxID=3058369 RepID=A0ABT8FDU0_9ACTN|nr:TadE/TadG family type IV pilus assembly protein [Nocardioides oceani]MDN4172853.1 TadE/TadG family type IV pilus assembly protein [Nocardioides oceani]
MIPPRRRDADLGAVTIEFALIALVLFTVLFGAVQYGYHYWALSTASATARELAREVSVGNDVTACTTVAKSQASTAALGPVQVDVAYAPSRRLGATVTVTVSFRSLDTLPVPLPRDASGDVVVKETSSQVIHDLKPDPSAC